MNDVELLQRVLFLQEEIATLRQHIIALEGELPDRYVTKSFVKMYIEQLLGDFITSSNKLTGLSIIKGYEVLDIDRIINKVPNSTYTRNDWRLILRHYDIVSKRVDINPYIVIAQVIKETDWLRSWWSQRPRRNPAGIGVTGETSTKEQNKNTWAFDSHSNTWKKGYSFSSWEISVKAHVGHMLAYMYKDNELTEEQKATIIYDPRASFIPKENRGSVVILNDLDGKWNISKTTSYGNSIAILANALRS